MPATRTISTKLKIEGESEYKSALSNINTELSNMKSRLAETSSEYQSNQNSLEALQAKTEALTGVQQSQADKVNVLRDAYNTASSTLSEYRDKGDQLTSTIQDNETKLSSMSTEVQEAGQQWADYSNKISDNEAKLKELESSTDDTSEEEAKLREEITQCQSAMDQLEAETDGAAKEAGELILQDQQLNSELDQNNQKTQAAENACNNWERQLNNAQTQLNNTDAELKETNQYLEEAEKSSDGCATSIDEFGNKMDSSANSADTLSSAIGAAGLVAATKKLIDAMGSCIQTAAAFEAQMSTVEALSGATSEEMDLLTQAAKEMGATTSFTATESAEALEYMALAGWDTEEMLDGLPGIINLAAAAGEDLGSTCDIVTDALTAFGLGAEDSAHFADVLASTATNSNTTVSQMGEAFKQVATTAGTLGYSIDDVSVALGLMADNGLKGSSAGTALSTALTRMSGANATATKELDELNVSMFNADGTTKDLSQFLGELRTALNENCTSSEEMQVALYNLAGQKGMKGLAAIVNTTDEDFESLTDSIANCEGSAEEMAEIRLDNFEGQVTLLQSAWDALVTTLGEAALGALTNVVEVLTDIVSAIGNFLSEHEMLAAAIDALVVGLAAMAAALITASLAVTKLSNAFKGLTKALAECPAAEVAILITALVAGISAFIAICVSAETEQKNLTKEMKDLKKQVEEETAAFEEEQEVIQQNADNYAALVDEMETLLENSDRTASEEERLKSIIEELNEYLGEGTITYNEQTGAIEENIDSVRELIEAHAEEEAYNELLERQKTLYDERTEAEKALETAREDNCTVLDRLQAGEELTGMEIAGYSTGVSQAAIVTGSYSDAITAAQDALDVIDAELEEVNAEIDAYNVVTDEAADTTNGLIVAAAEDLAEKLIALQDAYDEAYESAYDSITGQFELWEQLDEVTTTSFEDAMAAMESQLQYWEEYDSNVEELLSRNIDGLDELVLAYCDGSMESAGYIASMHEMTDEDLEAMIEKNQEVVASEQQFADDIAEAYTGFPASVDEAIQECIEVLYGLDLSDEEYQLAYDTLASYVGGLTDEEGEVTGEGESIKDSLLELFSDAENAAQMEQAATEQAEAYVDGLTYTLEEAEGPVHDIVQTAVDGAASDDNVAAAKDAGTSLAQGVEEGAESEEDAVAEVFNNMGNNALVMADWETPAEELGTAAADSIATGASAEESMVDDTFEAIGESADEAFTEGCSEADGQEAGANYIDGVADGAETESKGPLMTAVTNAAQNVGGWFRNILGILNETSTEGEADGAAFIDGAATGVEAEEGTFNAALKNTADSGVSEFESVCNENTLQPAGSDTVLGAITGAESQRGALNSSMTTTGTGGANAFKTGMPSSAGYSAGADYIQGAVNGEDSKRGVLTSKSSSSGQAASREFQNSLSSGTAYNTGANYIQGAVNGVNAKAGALASAAASAASSANAKFQATLQVASPSKLSEWILENYMEGGIIGVENKEADLSDSMADAAKRASESFSENMAMDTEDINASATMAYSASVSTTNTGMERIAAAMENLSQLDMSLLQYLPYLQDIAEKPTDFQLDGRTLIKYVRNGISSDQISQRRATGIV